MRITTPFFKLSAAVLIETIQAGSAGALNKRLANQYPELKLQLNSPGAVPAALRWNMHPQFGFPRKPFNVWRRRQNYQGHWVTIKSGLTDAVSGNQFYHWPMGEMYIVSVQVSMVAGNLLTIYPLDRENRPIPAREKTISVSGSAFIRTPFINGLEIVGTGTVNGIVGVIQSTYANLTDWQLVQYVGLPLATAEVKGLGYDGDQQGFITQPLVDAKTAALQRLALGAALQLPMPPTGDPMVPGAPWQGPVPVLYLKYLQNNDGLLPLINQCLTVSDDNSFFPSKRQPLFSAQQTVTGIHQPGASPGPDAIIQIPVVAATILAATTDNYAALALGFGTYDFPGPDRNRFAVDTHPAARAVNTNAVGYDYMVTSFYTVRPFEDFPMPFLDDVSKSYEFAALSDEKPTPVATAVVESLSLLLNRPMHWDDAATESVKLRWPKPVVPQSYAFLASYKDGSSFVMNSPYPFQPGAYPSFNTNVPQNVSLNADPNDANQFIRVFSAEPIPFTGVQLHKYFIACIDIFGRWSPFTRSLHSARSLNMLRPAVISVKLIPPAAPAATDIVLTSSLQIEFAWDWQDRSVDTIEIAGQFFQADTDAPAVPPAYFSTGTFDTLSDTVKITFEDRGGSYPKRVLPATSIGSITVERSPDYIEDGSKNYLPNDEVSFSGAEYLCVNPTSGVFKTSAWNLLVNETVRYRLVIGNIQAIFPLGPPYEIAYAIFIRGLEKVRLTTPGISGAGEWGPWPEHSSVARMNDPRPPLVVNFPAEVRFTALPDLTKTARGSLSWPPASGALNYNLWETNETAVRTMLGNLLESRFPGQTEKQLLPLTASLQDRATQLRDLLSQPSYEALCAKFYSKVNKLPMSQTSTEIELPGSSDILSLFKVSSVNSANIESERSNIIFYAVPKLVKPAAPSLSVRKYKDNQQKGFEIQLLNGNGIPPAGFKLFRNRKILVADDVGVKGPAYRQPDDLLWQPFESALRDKPYDKLQGKKIVDIISERSWKPYCYQAVAIGTSDPANGLLGGQSGGSVTDIVYMPPDVPPLLAFISPPLFHQGNVLIVMMTDAPFVPINGTEGTIDFYQTITNADGKFTKALRATWSTINVEDQKAAVVLANNSQPVSVPIIFRGQTDVNGITVFSVLFSSVMNQAIVRITDPLGRASEVIFLA
jgi:hypothetical protein